MRISVILEQRFGRDPQGRIWTPHQFPYEFRRQYLSVFDQVNVVARAAEVAEPPCGWARVDGPGVSCSLIPHYVGMLEYLRKRGRVDRACKDAIQHHDAVSFRLGSTLALHVQPHLVTAGRPYGVEVVSDPFDAFAPGAIRHPLRPALRWYLLREMRAICASACAAAYVTKRYLQRRYPIGPGRAAFSASDVMLPNALFKSEPRIFRPQREWRLLFVGSLAQRYKGLHVLLKALARAVEVSPSDLQLTVVGGGVEQAKLERQCAALHIEKHVHFVGELSREEVFKELDRADLFILPSLTEGLPRTLIEAMARGLPRIGSDAGGIPELLTPEVICRKGDAVDLSDTLLNLAGAPEHLTQLSRINLERAAEFQDEKILNERVAFWNCLREQTGRWIWGNAA